MDVLPKFVDMSRTPQELEEKEKEASTPFAPDVPVYPYGLCISLDNETLEKLDLDDDVEVGDMIHIHALAKVTSISKRDTADGGDCRIELQITGIALDGDDDEEDDEDDKDDKKSYLPSTSSMVKKAYKK